MLRGGETGKTWRPSGRFGGVGNLSMVPGYVQGGTRPVPGRHGCGRRLSQYCECLSCAGVWRGRTPGGVRPAARFCILHSAFRLPVMGSTRRIALKVPGALVIVRPAKYEECRANAVFPRAGRLVAAGRVA